MHSWPALGTVEQCGSWVRVRRGAVSKAVTFPGATTSGAICKPSHMPSCLVPIRKEVYLFILFTQVFIVCLLSSPSNLNFLPFKYRVSLTFHYKELQAHNLKTLSTCIPTSWIRSSTFHCTHFITYLFIRMNHLSFVSYLSDKFQRKL